ncbi:MAG: PAS domain S-box protein [bacterium]|nr:PAS domain S-box protein [bacterium]
MSTQGITPNARGAELLRGAADVIVEVGLDGRIIFVSDAVEPILARKPEFFLGRSFLEVIVAEDRTHALSQFQKVVATGAEPIVHFRVPRADGLRIEFESTVRIFPSEDGGQRIVCVARNVTQQSAERAIDRERDNHYRIIVESGSRPAAIVSPKGDIIFSNQKFKTIFGRGIALEDISKRMNEADRHALETIWFDTNRVDHHGSGAMDFQYSLDDGEKAWFDTTWEAFESEGGQRHFAVHFNDVSQRKKVEHAFRSIAQGITIEDHESLHRNVEIVAQALAFDLLLLGRLDPDEPTTLHVDVAWREGAFLDLDRFELDDLPDAAVARGEAVIFPSGVAQLIPSVADHVGRDVESYAGMPLRRADGTVIGLISGFGRQPIAAPELARSLLSAFATHAAAAIDRQRSEQEIRIIQDRFEVIAGQSHELLAEVDSEGRVTYVSEAVLPILGYRPEVFREFEIDSLTHPDDLRINRAFRAQLAAGEKETAFETRIRHADGKWRRMESRATTLNELDGAGRVLMVSRDVTERRRQEVHEDLLFRLSQLGKNLLFICEPDSMRLIFANERATRRLRETLGMEDPSQKPSQGGPTRDGDLGDRIFDELLSPAEGHRLRTEILPELTDARPWSGELELRDALDSSPLPTEAWLFLFRGEGESSQLFLGIWLRNSEAPHAAKMALRESELKLRQAQKMEAVGRLTGGIAHDFNNLLTAIIGYSDLVLDEIPDDHIARRDAEEILRAAERAGSLTRQLLAFSRRQVRQPTSVDLNLLVANIDRMMRRLIGENIELVTVQDGELRPIMADPGQIEQVIVNLVVNARDAMPKGGRLEIETANDHSDLERRTDSGILPAGDYVLLCVSDNGTGMNEEVRAQIFEPFFTTKATHQGTGLGLASVYEIVRQGEGQINVETSPNAGTRFTIYFPATQARAQIAGSAEDTGSAGGSETVLIVEDSPPVRRLAQRTLENSGYEVLVAESATAALRHCARHEGPIDLLLCDVVLPKTAGPEIARRARELRPGIRVLFMSGFTDETLTQHGLGSSGIELLEKPFTRAAVLDRIRVLLDAAPDVEEADVERAD